MKLLKQILCLCLAMALCLAAPDNDVQDKGEEMPDRCQGIEIDAATLENDGTPYFFYSHFLFRGFDGKAELANESFSDFDDYHNMGHADAALHMHFDDESHDHDYTFLFLDDLVYNYDSHKLVEGYPKNLTDVFPGIPDHLDAAVECPAPDCDEDSLLFFKGHEIYYYTLKTKAVEQKSFDSMPNCTSAFRFMDQYFCFFGDQFSKFNPKTGEVNPRYPKKTRDFFMSCPPVDDKVEGEQCSYVKVDAITMDDTGDLYAFRNHHYLHKAAGNDTVEVDAIADDFKEVHDGVSAAFSHKDHLHLIKNHQVFAYTVGDKFTLMEGYPSSLLEDLGIEGPVNAAFMCEGSEVVHVIKDLKMYAIDMGTKPRVANFEIDLNQFKSVDGAMCGPDGIKLFMGNHFYKFESLAILTLSKALPDPHKISMELFGCDH